MGGSSHRFEAEPQGPSHKPVHRSPPSGLASHACCNPRQSGSTRPSAPCRASQSPYVTSHQAVPISARRTLPYQPRQAPFLMGIEPRGTAHPLGHLSSRLTFNRHPPPAPTPARSSSTPTPPYPIPVPQFTLPLLLLLLLILPSSIYSPPRLPLPLPPLLATPSPLAPALIFANHYGTPLATNRDLQKPRPSASRPIVLAASLHVPPLPTQISPTIRTRPRFFPWSRSRF